ncbi:MAG: hypothetical protein GY701_29820 [Sulfitobacter sp.]|nr:hypothetical protein [Sulfitobacter sp.]
MTDGMQERLDTAVAWLAEKVDAGEVGDLDMRILLDSDYTLAVAVDGSNVWLADDVHGPHVAGGVWIADGAVHGEACDPDGTEYGAEAALGGLAP